jgi:glycerophosphoryl diester phosphodiesterase
MPIPLFDAEKKWIAGHRGAHNAKLGVFENTLAAFSRAIELGAEMIEFDIQKTKDNVLVVYHGSRNRIVYKKRKREIRNLTAAQVFEASEALGFSIPTFAEVISLTRGKIALDIELKKNEGQEEKIVDILFGRLDKSRDRFMISSFEESFISTVKERYPEIATGILVGNEISLKDNKKMLKKCIESKADFWAPRYNLIGKKFLKESGERKKKLITWVVNSKSKMERFFKMDEVCAVITDFPEAALSQRKLRLGA